jgi:hypothetical protein
MRRWFIVLMVLLMPIRGIIGDAMAYAMVTGMPASHSTALAQHETTNSIASKAVNTWTTSDKQHKNMPQMLSAASAAADTAASDTAPSAMPCHMGTMAKSDIPQPEDNNTTTSTCSACQVCHASVLPPFTFAPALLALPSTAPAYTTLAWHSAEPRQLAKNPIL